MTATTSTPRRNGVGASTGARPARRGTGRWIFPIPALLFLGFFALYPLAQLVRMSVSNVVAGTLNGAWPFVGLDNFARGWASGATGAALVRTLVFVLVVTVLGIGVGLAAAVALRDNGPWASAVLAIMVFCWALPPGTWPDPRIDAVRGQVAVERGPVVLCLESTDLGHDVEGWHVDPAAGLTDLGDAVQVTVAQVASAPGDWPYGATAPAESPERRVVALRPYHSWGNRGAATMRVWLPVAPPAGPRAP